MGLEGPAAIRSYGAFDPMKKSHVEKIFHVNLDDREWDIKAQGEEIEVSFNETDNVFGWIERIKISEFMARLEANSQYLRLC